MDRGNTFIDTDFEEIKNSEDETNLITKLNTPINILLSAIIWAVFLLIIITGIVL